MSVLTAVRDVVEATPFIDTHEHLLEESARLEGGTAGGMLPCDDWSLLLSHYLSDDLHSAGMPGEDLDRLYSRDLSVREKAALVAPWWQRVRHTGYGQAVRAAIATLYGIDDITVDTAEALQDAYRAVVKPGFYARVLRGDANIDHCHVNSLERTFMESALPDLLRQDLSILGLAAPDRDGIEREYGWTAKSLEDWHGIIDRVFALHGPQAVAVKTQMAYERPLAVRSVDASEAAPLFERLAAGLPLEPAERTALQDHLVAHCITQAQQHNLPVKMHTGYLAGTGNMDLGNLRRHAGDLCPLLQRFPDARFVLMHITYPYQDEAIALAKHYPNAVIDMCWAWIIDPAACVRFVKQFLVSAPSNKLLAFGGDYIPMENVVGHAAVARRGLAQAFAELVDEGWVALEEVPQLAARVMHGNAEVLFGSPA